MESNIDEVVGEVGEWDVGSESSPSTTIIKVPLSNTLELLSTQQYKTQLW